MSDSTLTRSARALGDSTVAAIAMLLVLAPMAEAQTQLAPITHAPETSGKRLPAIVSRAEYAQQQSADAQAAIDDPAGANGQGSAGQAGSRKGSADSALRPIGSGVYSLTRPAGPAIQAGRNAQPAFVKDPTVSAPEPKLANPSTSPPLTTRADLRRFASQNRMQKDLTVSLPIAGGALVGTAQFRESESQRRYSNMTTARLPFESEANPFQSDLPAVPSTVRDITDPALNENENQSLRESPSTKSTTVDSFSGRVDSSLPPVTSPVSRSAADSGDAWLAEEAPFSAPSLSQGLVHGALPESCNCASPVAEFWRPEGMDLPWPPDEYICDGGDADVRVAVNRESQVSGLNLEDTVAHYDTEDGRTLVTPSNCVCIYSPRFAAVRKIIGAREDDRLLRPGLYDLPLPPVIEELTRPPLVVEQPLPPRQLLDLDGPLALRDRRRGLELDQTLRVAELVREFQAYEDFQIMRIGIDKSADKARIIEHITAAIEWSRAEAPEVIIDDVAASVDTAIERTGVIYQVDGGPPCLRIIKLANRCAALPGEFVEFSLRYDNIGEQTVENVTVIDNLTTRLEYVPGSSQSDRKAEFFGDENQGESLVLRWVIKEPLRPGDGGLIRFKCKVR